MQDRVTIRVRSFDFIDREAGVIPVIAIPGHREVSQVYDTHKKLVVGIVAFVLALTLRITHALANIDSSLIASNATTFVIHVILPNVLSGALEVENGHTRGIPKFYRGGRPSWALWASRILVYGCPLRYFDVRQKALSRLRLK